MLPKIIVHNWDIKDGDYHRDANYDKLYFDDRRRKEKLRKLFIAGAGMALLILLNIMVFPLLK